MSQKYLASLRIRGEIEETGKWMGLCDYVDISISQEEAERIVKFLIDCINKK